MMINKTYYYNKWKLLINLLDLIIMNNKWSVKTKIMNIQTAHHTIHSNIS